MNAVITGYGALTPLGTADQMWPQLLEGASAARNWPDLESQGYRITTACRIADFSAKDVRRGQDLAIAAARQAVQHANVGLEGRVGIYVGTTMGESMAFERAAEGAPLDLASAAASAYPRAIQQDLGVQGPVRAYGAACAAGNYAIGAGAMAVSRGRVEVAIAGGVDAFSRIAMLGFSRSRAMAPDLCRPFDAERLGMQLGEAAAFVVLENEAHARACGAKCFARVSGLGLSCDAFHPTAPRPDGSGMAAAMRSALTLGQIEPEAIDFICAHGTGTRASDAAEAAAISQVFTHRPPVSGVKGALGHSLGAATAVEAIVTLLALYHRVLPPTANFRKRDPEMQIAVVTEAQPAPDLRWALNCGYAFGGLNSAFIDGGGGMNARVAALISALADAMLPFAAAEDWLVQQVTALVPGSRPELTGLYLATMDAGVQASIQFWADGLRDGLGFANPRDFPLTLANSPAARIAIHHNLQGPNYTIIGGDEATEAALEHAQDDLWAGLIESALVIRFDLMPETSVIGLTLTTAPFPQTVSQPA